MLRLTAATLVLVASLVSAQGRVFACATLRASGHIDQFSCGCSEDLETPITVVTGTALVGNGRATPTLTSLIVELQARPKSGPGIYQPVGRQVISDKGTDFPPPRTVTTCKGDLDAGPVPGRVQLIDGNQN